MNTAQTIMAGFELGDLDANPLNQVTFNVAVIEDLDGEPKTGFIIVGKNSEEYQLASAAMRQAGIKRSAKRSQAVDTSTDEGAALVNKTVTDNERILALAVVKDWFGFTLEGAPMQFDKLMVEKLFTKFPTWQAKVNLALDNDKNFMKV